MAFADDKQAILTLIRQTDCQSADDISERFNSYDEGVEILFEFAVKLSCKTDYLQQILMLVPDSELVARGVYLNKSGTTVNNPRLLVGSIYNTVNLTYAGIDHVFIMAKGSSASTVNVDNSTTIQSLNVWSGSTLDLLDIKEGSQVRYVNVSTCPGLTSTVNAIKNQFDSTMDVYTGEGAVFSGFVCIEPTVEV